MKKEKIAIIGMSGLFAGAENISRLWRNICEEVDSIIPVPASRWSLDDYYDEDPLAPDKTYSRVGGFIPEINFDPMEFGLPPNILEVTDSSQLLALAVAKEALKDAGYWNNEKFSKSVREKTGVILGAGGGQKLIIPLTSRLQYPIWRRAMIQSGILPEEADRIVGKIKQQFVPWEENSFPGSLSNVIAGRITNRLDLGGTNCVVDAACAASLSAIKMAVRELQSGQADMVISGGVDTDNSPSMYLSFSKTPAFSRKNKIRPFDAEADGMVVGEGIGMVVFKRLSDAERDGDRIYAVIAGIGSSSDGKNKSIYAPQSSGQVLAMRRCYEDAGYDASTVGLLECHGTGTPAGDLSELNSMLTVFGENNPSKGSIAIGSIKSQIGHTKAAAGAAGLIKATLALHNKALPPTINVSKPNTGIDINETPLYINTHLKPWIQSGPRRASISAFGFGGTNFHVALEEYSHEHSLPYRSAAAHTVLLGAADETALAQLCEDRIKGLGLTGSEKVYKKMVEDSRESGFSEKSCRIGFVCQDSSEAIVKLKNCVQLLRSGDAGKKLEHPGGIAFSKEAKDSSSKVAALFSGQGSQYTNMARHLSCAYPLFRETLEKVDLGFPELKLSQLIYPVPAFTKEKAEEQQETLRQTQYAQPAIGAISAAYYELLTAAGFKADMIAGHSFGELSALWAAGVIGKDDFFELARSRGEAMASGNAGESTMLAVMTDTASLQAFLASFPNVKIANENAEKQVVLGGSVSDIERLKGELEKVGIDSIPLQVSAAFHTPFVAHAAQPFAEKLRKVQFKKPKTDIYSNSLGAKYPTQPAKIRSILEDHMLNPVLFRKQVENMYEDGARIFVEFGPKSVLTSLVKKILADRPHTAIALNPVADKNSEVQLLEAFVKMKVAGLQLDHPDAWELKPEISTETDSRMNISIGGANYLSEKTLALRKASEEDGFKISTPPIAAAPAATVKSPGTLSDELFDTQIEGFQKMLELMQLQIYQMRQARGNATMAPLKEPLIPAQLTRSVLNPPVSPASEIAPITTSVDISTLSEAMLSVVSEKTGYPASMLEMDMDMEADLGIDSIKRVEIFGAMQEKYPNLTGANPQEMAELNTLAQVVAYIGLKIGDQSAGTEIIPVVAEIPPGISSFSDMGEKLLEIVSEKTGYPASMLEMDMDMEADLGIDSIKRVEIFGAMQEAYPGLTGANPQEMAELRTLGQVGGYISEKLSGVMPEKTSVSEAQAPHPDPSSTYDLSSLSEAMLEVVSEKTGYPSSMLETDMDMEADLGIDSIKRVEIFGAMQEKYPGLTGANPQEMAELRTLGQVAAYIGSKLQPGKTAGIPSQPSGPKQETGNVFRYEAVLKYIPLPDFMEQEWKKEDIFLLSDDGSELTVSLVKKLAELPVQVRLLQFPEKHIPLSNTRKLPKGLKSIVLSKGDDAEIKDLINTLSKEGSVKGFIHLHPQSQADSLSASVAQDGPILKTVFFLAKHLKTALNERTGTARSFFLSSFRLDGSLGLNNSSNFGVNAGALAGLVKTLNYEWEHVFCRAVDLHPSITGKKAADILFAEIHDPNLKIQEVAYDGKQRSSLFAVKVNSLPDTLTNSSVSSSDVFLVSGGARGITAACIIRLAELHQPKFILLGRTSITKKEVEWANGIEEAELKKILFDRLSEEGKKVSPKEVQQVYNQITAQREIENTLASLKNAGSKVEYINADVTDAALIKKRLPAAIKKLGAITGIIHGAGKLADKAIEQKTEADYDSVLSVKTEGLLNLLDVVEEKELRHLLLFSSVAGFFGNAGQADYAMANEVLNKTAWLMQKRNPGCRVVSYNWGPWDGGMVTPELKKLFAERNVATIPVDFGTSVFVSELGSTHTQVIVGSALPSFPGTPDKELREYSIHRHLTPEQNPFVNDHRIAGYAVLPIVNGIVWMADVCAQLYPGYKVSSCENARLYKGIVFDDKHQEDYKLSISEVSKSEEELVFETKVSSIGKGGQTVFHYAATIHLRKDFPSQLSFKKDFAHVPLVNRPGEELYMEKTLFHGPMFQGVKEVVRMDDEHLLLRCQMTAVDEKAQGQFPVVNVNTFLADIQYQGMVIWARKVYDAVGLPVSSARAGMHRYMDFDREFFVLVEIKQHSPFKMIADVTTFDENGNVYFITEGAEVALSQELKQAFLVEQIELGSN